MNQAGLPSRLSICLRFPRPYPLRHAHPQLSQAVSRDRSQFRAISSLRQKIKSKLNSTQPATTPKSEPAVRLVRAALRRPSDAPDSSAPSVASPSQKSSSDEESPRDLRLKALFQKPGFTPLVAPSFEIAEIPVDVPPVPRLAHGLDRTLFNRGINQLRDLHSRVYNFDPSLEKLPAVQDVNFDTLRPFYPSSKDPKLATICLENNKKYAGSTSSMTDILKHLHFLLSSFRPLFLGNVSPGLNSLNKQFTKMQRAPSSVFLRWKDGFYAIDSDKEGDTPNILSLMGQYLEAFLTQDFNAFERHLKTSPNPDDPADIYGLDAHHYSTVGDILMRSQLDAYDPRLPGTGVFDLKTRAVLPIRMNSSDFSHMIGYELQSLHGTLMSYEREFADLVRSTLLKYSLQARMGRMDGILLAYHNITRMFGFQYLSIEEMDSSIHGQSNRSLGDAEFIYSMNLLNAVLDLVTKEFPEQSLRITFDTVQLELPFMNIFAEAISDEQIDVIQSEKAKRIAEWERVMKETGLPPPWGENEAAEAGDAEQISVSSNPQANVEVNHETTVNSSQESPQEVDPKHSAPKPEADRQDPQVLHLTLQTRSVVRGERVDRPENLQNPSEWKLFYNLKPNTDEVLKQKLYKETRRRQKNMWTRDKELDQYFDRLLARTVSQSKDWRMKQDDRDAADEEKRGGIFVWNSDSPIKREDFYKA